MSIVKSKHASNYVVIPNEIFKQGLSIEAVGLLTYFLSLPHDWVIYKTQLHEQLGIGREKTDRVFKELQNSGYVLTVKGYNKNGQIEYNHIVYDKPYNGEPQTGKPLTVESSTINTQLQSKEEQSKEELINYSSIKILNIEPKEELINSLNTEGTENGQYSFGSVAVVAKPKRKKRVEDKIRFEDSIIFDKHKFKEHFNEWNKAKLIHYYNSALSYSVEGNKYVDWGMAINNWASRDENKGMKFKGDAPLQETETERKIREFKARGF
jgi:hypothetical protein